MPGPYAHITLLYELMRPGRLKSIFSPLSGFDVALETYFSYCVLGAVSPDYPNLVRGNAAAAQWADAMHYTRACEMITSGIRCVRNTKEAARNKQLAWLLGYCAHVATDVTIHPVVQVRVGLYAENQRQHRVCEMNQDSHIYHRMNLGEIGEADLYALAVTQCSTPGDRSCLDPDIASIWEGMLADVHPGLFATNPPDSSSWHREFVAIVDDCAAGPVRLFPLACVIAEKMGLTYPVFSAVDPTFIEEQTVPTERLLSLYYDDIFFQAIGNVMMIWRQVEQAVFAEDSAPLPLFGDWNLDNGRDEHGRLVFWQ